MLHAISPISMKLCQFKGSTQNSKWQSDFSFRYFRGEIDHPPGFLGFSPRNRFKISKLYEVLTATVFNILPWQSADILVHPQGTHETCFNLFDWRFVNQQCRTNYRVFDLFDSLEYLITLRSNIPPCQKATTLIWMPLSNPSLHLWKSLKKFLGAAIFLSWLPFEICDYDKLLNYECHAILAVSGHLSK